jgi:ubiquinone/menaquinone biosynthesis C-methylase UbiE
MPRAAGPAAPAVAPDTYDDDYYRRVCAGADEWSASGGARASGLYGGMLLRAGMRPGETVVDIGTGRGELLAEAVGRGAARAIGIDYSEAAVELARTTLRVRGVEESSEVLLADGRSLPLPDGCADLVTLIDVVEHLTVGELSAVLDEARRLLRPGGRVFIHTMPTRTLYEVTYRLHRWAVRLRGERWPRQPRNEYELAMHVNEQTRRTLRRDLRAAGFARVRVEPGGWIHTEFLPDPRSANVYRRLARVPGVRRLVIADLFAVAVRPGAAR